MADSKSILKTAGRVAATLIVVAIAIVLGRLAWDYYVYQPWTRDARVQADVVNIAPEVHGTVTEVGVRDDSYVRKGDLLFKVQPIRYKLNLQEAQASLQQALAQRKYALQEQRRVESLPPDAISKSNLQQTQSKAQEAVASVAQARVKLEQAKKDMDWSTVVSPVNGYITHLLLNEGDYASQGESWITLVNADTFRTVAYFEETKIDKIHVGDPVDITLMTGNTKLKGHVASIGYGIAVDNNSKGERNLPQVDPTFQWVRLAQRIPVTIAFDEPPEKLALSVGMTATVHVRSKSEDKQRRKGLRAIFRLHKAQRESQKSQNELQDQTGNSEETDQSSEQGKDEEADKAN